MVRQEWVVCVTREFQVLAGQLLDLPGSGRVIALDALLDRLPKPCDPLEHQLFESWRLRARLECDRESSPSQSSASDPVSAYIDAHLSDRLTLRSISNELRMEPRAVAAAFQRIHHTSVREYVHDRRFRAAQVLLASGVKVQAVSACLGFGSRTTLYRLVKKKTGLTPRRVTEDVPATKSESERQVERRRHPDITREPCASCQRLRDAAIE